MRAHSRGPSPVRAVASHLVAHSAHAMFIHVHATRHRLHTRRVTPVQPCSRMGTYPGQSRRNTMVPKSFSRASLGCPVRLRNNTMPAAIDEGGVLPWRELSMTWGSSRRQDHGQQQRPEGWLVSSPASSIVEDIDFCGRGSMFQKNARRNAARSEGVWPRRPLQRPKRN